MGRSVKIGITGFPGAGKTKTLIQVIKMLEEDEFIVGGMITESIIEKGSRVGFYVKDWVSGEKAILAHKDFDSKITVGKYGVDLSALETVGVRAITTAVEQCDIIVIDEVGKMEVESEKFIEAVSEAFQSDKPMILTLHKKSRNPLLQDIRRRDDVRILEVTAVNMDLLPYKIRSIMQGEIV